MIVGGAVTFVVTVLAALLLGWISSPRVPSGTVLYTTSKSLEKEFDRASGDDKYTSEMKINFFNLKGEISNFSLLIPLRNLPDDFSIEAEGRDAVLKSVMSKDEAKKLGALRIDVESLDEGGEIYVTLRSQDPFYSEYVEPTSPSRSVKLVSPSTIHIYL